ncbi:hypothetical protein TA5114_00723 [Cognatishimia activa]|uniref:Uncharacterized protein n=1 Tax=Cognatishimia activa TaxID=1715691 RepID=A0A0P1IN17_9RHOB|nr:hypothetical protein TA5113_02370 [Cognatishimia activa]CUK24934.1 hypothetical protein TA5114_00723 [Cognatishimia activa]
MRPPAQTVFLERQTYRRRRLIDLIKILPLIGLVLWLVPLLWPTEGAEQVSSANATIYIFAIWFVLIVAKALSVNAFNAGGSQKDDELKGDERGQS